MLHESIFSTSAANDNDSTLPTRQTDRDVRGSGGYSHILIPTNFDPRERSAIRLGLEMAAVHRAKVTVLHVLPGSARSPSVHWLDAIDNLYDALSRSKRRPGENNNLDAIERTRQEIFSFLTREVHRDLACDKKLTVECRIGDVANEIARYVDDNAVDLVVLCCDLSQERPRSLSQRVRSVLQTIQRQVVLVRPAGDRLDGGESTHSRPASQDWLGQAGS